MVHLKNLSQNNKFQKGTNKIKIMIHADLVNQVNMLWLKVVLK